MKFTDNIVMIEPNRFDSDGIKEISSKLNLERNTIEKLKSMGVSKAWIWKKTGEVIFTKIKGFDNIKYNKIDLNLDNIKTFSLIDVVQKENLNLDTILDKISKYGKESLSNDEKEFLTKF